MWEPLLVTASSHVKAPPDSGGGGRSTKRYNMTHYTQRIAMSRLLRGLPLQDLADALPSYHPYPSAASLSRISLTLLSLSLPLQDLGNGRRLLRLLGR